MTDKSENKSTDESTDKSKNYIPLAVIVLGAPILVIVFLVVMRCAFKPPARISVMRETTTQPVPFDAETREQVRDFVADEIDRQTGQSHQQFNALASAIITAVATLIAVAMAIFGFSWWRQTREHDKVIKEAEGYRTAIKQTAETVEKDAETIKTYLQEVQGYTKQVKKDREQAEGAARSAAKSAEASMHFTQALTYQNKDELDKAIKEYGKAIELDPKNAWAYNNRGSAWADKGEFDKAIEDCNKAIELAPKDADYYYNRGCTWADKGELDKAIEDFNKAIELDPKEAGFYNNRGAAWTNKGGFDQAIEDYGKAIELDPKNAVPYNNRGAAWANKGGFDQAIEDFNKAIELDPKNASFYLNVAETLMTLGQDFCRAAERLEQGQGHNAFGNDRNRLVASYLEGIALALKGEDASAAEAEAKRLQAGGAKAGDWDTEPMDRFLKDLKPEDFKSGALETARRIQEMLKN